MDDWKRLINRGNLSFERGELGLARALYQDALCIADRRLPSWPDADAAVAAFVVSHHNLADLYQRLDQTAEASRHVAAAHARLVQLMTDTCCTPALQQAALRHSHRTRGAGLAFTSGQNGPVPLRWLHDTDDAAISSLHRHLHSKVDTMPYTLPPLPYAFDALEPHIDARTMEVHYTKHHQTYITNVNKALEGSPLADLPVEQVIGQLERVPEAQRNVVRNNGGGHANHALFWTVMSPGGGGAPSGALAEAIDRDLGGLEAFRQAFTQAALSRFGSGWAWLSVLPDGRLAVESDPNQDSPLMRGHTPILGLDVWEHAYYLQYQNRRPEYIAAFYNVVDWAEVARRYGQATQR